MSVFRAKKLRKTPWSVPAQRKPPAQPAVDDPTERLYRPSDSDIHQPDANRPSDKAGNTAGDTASDQTGDKAGDKNGDSAGDQTGDHTGDQNSKWDSDHQDSDRTLAGTPVRHLHLGVIVAVVFAGLALVTAGAASLVAVHAMNRPVRNVPLPAPAITPPSVPLRTIASSPLLQYAQEPLQIAVACGGSAGIDLHLPPRLIIGERQTDLRYDNRCGSAGMLAFAGDARVASHVADPDLDRPGCAEAISAHPLDAGEGVPVVKGTVLCVDAGTMLALVEVTGVGPNGAASLRATGWTAPAADGVQGPVVPSVLASPAD